MNLARLRNLTIGVSLTVAGLTGYLLWSATGTPQTGWVQVSGDSGTGPAETGPGDSVYRLRIRGDHPLYRGNDLFAVTTARIVDRDGQVVTQSLDRSNRKGFIQFSTDRPLASGERLSVVYRLSIRWEKLIPVLLVIGAVIGVARLLRRLWTDPTQLQQPIRARRARLATVICVGLFSCCVLWFPGWIYGDDFFIISHIVQGKPLPLMAHPENGRFFPLGLIDLNLLLPFGDSPAAYHLERFGLLILTVSLMYLALSRSAGPVMGCFLVVVFLTTPDLFRIYADSIFPEALLSLLLTGFFLFYLRGASSGNRWQLAAALLFAGLATYCKEPVFGLLLVFALVQLVFGYRILPPRLRYTNLLLVLNGVLFAVAYWIWFTGGGENYAAQHNDGTGRTRLGVFLTFCKSPAFVLALGWGSWRAFCLIVRGDRLRLVHDGTLLAGLAYAMAYIFLRLDHWYYLIPAYICWVTACAGYIGELIGQGHPSPPSAEEPPRPRSTPTGFQACLSLVLLIVVGSLQFPGTITTIRTSLQQRHDTRVMEIFFRELKQAGYEVRIWYPDEMVGFARHVQDWRQEVLRAFDNGTRSQGPADHEFRELQPQGLPLSHDRCVVLHDPRYSVHDLNRDRRAAREFVLLEGLPVIMSGRLYAPGVFHDELQDLFDTLNSTGGAMYSRLRTVRQTGPALRR